MILQLQQNQKILIIHFVKAFMASEFGIQCFKCHTLFLATPCLCIKSLEICYFKLYTLPGVIQALTANFKPSKVGGLKDTTN